MEGEAVVSASVHCAASSGVGHLVVDDSVEVLLAGRAEHVQDQVQLVEVCAFDIQYDYE